jgi:cytochrome c-type biogenesis protein CcmH
MNIRFATKWLLPLAGSLLLLLALSWFWDSPLAHAQTPETAFDEAEAQSIDRMIMCPVCPAESIDQAQVPIARQMRQLVREKLSQGASRQEILDFFSDNYGPDILASPPKSGFNLVAWVLPIAGVLAALAAGVLAIRSMTVRRPVGALAGQASPPLQLEQDLETELEPYLAAVDRQLNLPDTAPESTNEPDSGGNTSDGADGNVEPHREGGPETNG